MCGQQEGFSEHLYTERLDLCLGDLPPLTPVGDRTVGSGAAEPALSTPESQV